MKEGMVGRFTERGERSVSCGQTARERSEHTPREAKPNTPRVSEANTRRVSEAEHTPRERSEPPTP